MVAANSYAPKDQKNVSLPIPDYVPHYLRSIPEFLFTNINYTGIEVTSEQKLFQNVTTCARGASSSFIQQTIAQQSFGQLTFDQRPLGQPTFAQQSFGPLTFGTTVIWVIGQIKGLTSSINLRK
uniref:Uncharacterized protein n=1 Tax=Megaselia scalaris TaxID=36166 RepID=T1GM54_MEGSC